MTYFKDRTQAISLRKQKMSYSQIKNILHISKSTLSVWLKDYPLTKERINELRGKSEKRIERYRETMKNKREKRLKETYSKEKINLLPLSKKTLYIAGLLLYWGEGGKYLKGAISLNNTDPMVMKFYLYWLTKILNIKKEKIKVYLHLYNDMDVKTEISYWSDTLSLSTTHFTKPYIKKNTREKIDQKGFGHGTCGLIVCDIFLKEKIMMGIKAISDYYGAKIANF